MHMLQSHLADSRFNRANPSDFPYAPYEIVPSLRGLRLVGVRCRDFSTFTYSFSEVRLRSSEGQASALMSIDIVIEEEGSHHEDLLATLTINEGDTPHDTSATLKAPVERGEVLDCNIPSQFVGLLFEAAPANGAPALSFASQKDAASFGGVKGTCRSYEWHYSTNSWLVTIDLEASSLNVSDHAKLSDYLNDALTNLPDNLSIRAQIDKVVREEVLRVVDDCIARKQGVTVILRHLKPYFARLLGRSVNDYRVLKQNLWKEMDVALLESTRALQLFKSRMAGGTELALMEKYIARKEFRESLASEIPFLVCRLAFESARALSYIRALKKLDRRFHSSYNALSILLNRAAKTKFNSSRMDVDTIE